MSRYYEEREYYVKESERRYGMDRQMVEQEFSSRGRPFESDLRPLTDFPLRFADDWDSRRFREPHRSSHDHRRQHSLPPKRTTAASSAYAHTGLQSSLYQDNSSYQQRTAPPAQSYRREPPISTDSQWPQRQHDLPRSQFPATSSSSRPGSPQATAGAGDIINTENGFTIQLDAKHFSPHEIKVSLIGNSLSITGEHIEENPHSTQSLKRSFSRRYAIPDDIRLDSIKSHMTDSGMLVVRGSRKTWKQTDINVHLADHAMTSDV